MKKQSLLLLAGIATLFVTAVGCEDETTGTTGSSSSSSSASGSGSTSSSSGNGGGGAGGGGNVMPALGMQIDRMGRPAINTAANKTFEPDVEKADMGKAAYNQNGDPATWASFVPEIQANLAILDSLDGMCGNQLAVDITKLDATRYANLATVLADDRLYVNSTGTACTTYLGVEANALGIMNMDCGGRTLAYDVIETSYSVLAAGILAGVDDTIKITPAAQGTTFPYLIAPY